MTAEINLEKKFLFERECTSFIHIILNLVLTFNTAETSLNVEDKFIGNSYVFM